VPEWLNRCSIPDARLQFFLLVCFSQTLPLFVSPRYTSNRTSTTKYNWVTFLPGSLFVQYRRAAYWYFTAMAILSFTPFSPYSQISVVLPLVFVLALGVGREFWEDLRRSRGDAAVNSGPAQVLLDGESIQTLQWKDLRVGDLVRVSDGEYFPADLFLLSSSGVDGVCYVETKNLDGETNLKVS
jgi:phospholipid-translocating ATPase